MSMCKYDILCLLIFTAMKGYSTLAFLSVVVAACCLRSSTAAPTSKAVVKPSAEELLFLARLMAPLKELSQDVQRIQSFVEQVTRNRNMLMTGLSKRQPAWDLDYGWGGGRFGKRSERPTRAKQYDMYNFGGRFGRDVSHVDTTEQHWVEDSDCWNVTVGHVPPWQRL